MVSALEGSTVYIIHWVRSFVWPLIVYYFHGHLRMRALRANVLMQVIRSQFHCITRRSLPSMILLPPPIILYVITVCYRTLFHIYIYLPAPCQAKACCVLRFLCGPQQPVRGRFLSPKMLSIVLIIMAVTYMIASWVLSCFEQCAIILCYNHSDLVCLTRFKLS